MYPTWSKEADFDQWYRTFKSQALQHQLDWVLDPTYVPTTPDDVNLFNALQRFAYTVFEYILHTDTGKRFLRIHEDTQNSQLLLRDLLKHHHDSPLSSINAASGFSYIATVKYDNTWSLGAYQFLLHWENSCKTYNNLKKDPLDRLSDGNKLQLLQIAVIGVAELRSVKTFVEANCRQNGTVLTFKIYYDQLVDAAMTFDNKTSFNNLHEVVETSNPVDPPVIQGTSNRI
jgi:hypothetical protein